MATMDPKEDFWGSRPMTPDPTTAASGGLSAARALGYTPPVGWAQPGWTAEFERWWEANPQTRGDDKLRAATAFLAGQFSVDLRTHPSPPSPARGEELEAALREAVYAWVREDAGMAMKLSLTAEQTNKLLSRLVLTARPSVTTDAGAVTEIESDLHEAVLQLDDPYLDRWGCEGNDRIVKLAIGLIQGVRARLSRAQAYGGKKRVEASDGEGE